MSLVAYADSSDEDSQTDNEETPSKPENLSERGLNGHISDDDDYEQSVPNLDSVLVLPTPTKKLLNLPAPSISDEATEETQEDTITPAFDKLPQPKAETGQSKVIEEDDEFLHKKEKPSEEKPPPIAPKKGPVKITIPSLSQFRDLEIDKPSTVKPSTSEAKMSSGLLGLLPKPRHEMLLQKAKDTPSTSKGASTSSVTSLIPDSVKNRANKKPATKPSKQIPQRKALVAHGSDSEDSDADGGDFFSLNTEHKLPEVSANEINAMVAKRAAQMATAASRVNEMLETKYEEPSEVENPATYDSQVPSTSHEVNFDDRAIKALVGSRAKRQKMEEMNIVELSANQVLPNQDEWLRTALASSTSYQARGVLVDEEPSPGTRRKHQITYLAHQAKANELELQAMWSANRHTRRQTQGKYGF